MSTEPQPDEVITAELTGLKIRKLSRDQMLQTGFRVCNKHGQNMWTIEAFHPNGVRICESATGALFDCSWEQLYSWYERLPIGFVAATPANKSPVRVAS